MDELIAHRGAHGAAFAVNCDVNRQQAYEEFVHQVEGNFPDVSIIIFNK